MHRIPRPRAPRLAAFALACLAIPYGCARDGPEAGDGTPEGKGAATEPVPVVEYLSSPAFAAMGLPFSEAVRVGDLLFLSGQIGAVPGETRLVEGGIGPETRQTMENIRRALERHGSSLDRVVKCTVMLADMAEWSAMNEVYAAFFPEGRRPARSALGASGLALGARVEIECTAVVDPTAGSGSRAWGPSSPADAPGGVARDERGAHDGNGREGGEG